MQNDDERDHFTDAIALFYGIIAIGLIVLLLFFAVKKLIYEL